jgi:hypothetical protein
MREGSREKGSLLGRMDLCTKATFRAISWKALVKLIGRTINNTKVIGETTKCTEKVSSSGLMEESMKATTSTTRKTDLDVSGGRMEDNMRDNGKTALSTARENTKEKTVSGSKVGGRTVSG